MAWGVRAICNNIWISVLTIIIIINICTYIYKKKDMTIIINIWISVLLFSEVNPCLENIYQILLYFLLPVFILSKSEISRVSEIILNLLNALLI